MRQYKVISFDIFQTLVDVNERIPQIWKEILGDAYTKEAGQLGAGCIVKQIGPLYEAVCRHFIPMEEGLHTV